MLARECVLASQTMHSGIWLSLLDVVLVIKRNNDIFFFWSQ